MNPFQFSEQLFAPDELVNEIRELLPVLRQQGIKPGTVLAIQSNNPDQWVPAWALARSTGHPFMPLSPDLGAVEVETILNNACCAVLLEMKDGQGSTPGLSLRSSLPASSPVADTPVRLIVHTSGSEGVPRGVMHTRDSLKAASHTASQRLSFDKDDLWLCCLAPWHIGGIAILERALYNQARVLIQPGFNASSLLHALKVHPVTHLSLVPAMLARLLDEAGSAPPPSHLRRVLIGGGPLSKPLFLNACEKGWPLCVSYGLTEAGSQVATLCSPGSHWQPGDVGTALEGMNIAVEASDAGYGPIRLRGASMMFGYLNPGLNPGDGLSPDGWFSSNDLGRLAPDSHLQVLGRNDDVIVSGGVNIHPATVEQALSNHPGVKQVAVVGTPDPAFGEIVTALVVGSADSESLMT